MRPAVFASVMYADGLWRHEWRREETFGHRLRWTDCPSEPLLLMASCHHGMDALASRLFVV